MAGRSGADKKKAEGRKQRNQARAAAKPADLAAQHRRLMSEHAALVAIGGASVAEKQARALAEELVWTSLAMWLIDEKDYVGAAKASSAGNKCAELALAASKSTLADRVSQLEADHAAALNKGAQIRGAARSIKRRLR